MVEGPMWQTSRCRRSRRLWLHYQPLHLHRLLCCHILNLWGRARKALEGAARKISSWRMRVTVLGRRYNHFHTCLLIEGVSLALNE